MLNVDRFYWCFLLQAQGSKPTRASNILTSTSTKMIAVRCLEHMRDSPYKFQTRLHFGGHVRVNQTWATSAGGPSDSETFKCLNDTANNRLRAQHRKQSMADTFVFMCQLKMCCPGLTHIGLEDLNTFTEIANVFVCISF